MARQLVPSAGRYTGKWDIPRRVGYRGACVRTASPANQRPRARRDNLTKWSVHYRTAARSKLAGRLVEPGARPVDPPE